MAADDLAGVVQRQLDRWDLRPDGEPRDGPHSLALPVRTADAAQAVLKIGRPGAGSEHEHLVLRRWGGNCAVRLLCAHPHHRALLLERLQTDSLTTLPDVDACEVVAGLYRRLHVPAMPQLATVASHLERWSGDFETLPRSAPIPHRLVEQALALSRGLAAEPPNTVLHGNLHDG